MSAAHTPVMLSQVLEILAPRDGGIYVDGTFGAGGYSRAILDAARCTIWGIDRDPGSEMFAADLGQHYPGRVTVLRGRYGDMKDLLSDVGVDKVDGVALDLGVSSMQLDDPSRGFSFSADGPLDMRMGRKGMTAADVVNELAEQELADILYRLGDERASRRIARAIVKARSVTPITRTFQLADLVRSTIPRTARIDPATRTFQALRIYVNDELEELDKGLSAAEELLAPGGRLCVVSFHSLEDGRVKDFLRTRSEGAARPSRHRPYQMMDVRLPSFRLLRRGAVKPTADEVSDNPRARSARLRAAERTAAPVWPGPRENPDSRAA